MLVAGLLVPVSLAARPVPGARGRPRRVVSWNLRNWLAMDRMIEGAFHPGWPKPQAETEAATRALAALRPDLLVVQELGGTAELEHLAGGLAAAGHPLPRRLLARAADPDRHLAVLASDPWTELAVHHPVQAGPGDRARPVKRGILEVVPGWPGAPRVLAVHLKSGRVDDGDPLAPRERREAEARVVRDLARERLAGHPDEPLLVIGDLNGLADDPAVRRLTTVGDRPLLQPLAAADEDGDCWTWSHPGIGLYQRLDWALASPALAARPGLRAWLADSADIRLASDHRPLVVDLG